MEANEKTLYERWKDLTDNQSEKSFDEFWKKYCQAEIKIYSSLLTNPSETATGTFDELVARYDVDEVLFMGFLDGISSSLPEPLDVEKIEPGTELSLPLELEKLYRNMLAADAAHLHTLPEWDPLLSEERRLEITKEYKRSKIYVKEKTPERNDPCPCGSGKKYKKCCGA